MIVDGPLRPGNKWPILVSVSRLLQLLGKYTHGGDVPWGGTPDSPVGAI